ncbi:hypothetical protein G6F56_011159 [Rhizopus delemar]|uniref:Phosphatidylglycerol/phosphatidylinositol transfer protein n=1 Tax=Rhizopus stolonifer TaxID=4846 RepID=A0A367IIY4_RHIST|nr:hypothetical protein G6F56_011159 [Rhizopus delemar]RCH77637.1 Phosphatidylglycerol/phosphatidylinositol transfer protein [Rhizopus stolonifer]
MYLKDALFCFLVCTALWAQVEAGVAFWSNNYFESNVIAENCGAPSDVFQLESFKVSPDIIEPGKQVNITITGSLSEKVEDGAYADVMVKVGRIKILKKEFDICEELRKREDEVDIQCPFEKGDISIFQTVTLPKEIPPAIFKVSTEAYTANDDSLACLDLLVDFRRKHSLLEGVLVQ